MAAIGGLDAHQTGVRVGGRVLSPMRHDRSFRLLRTHALLDGPLDGSVADDRARVYRALAQGSAFLHRPTVAPAEGARFAAAHANGRTTPMGAEGPADRPVLDIRLPCPADIRLLRDGRPVAEASGARHRHRAEAPGAYRFEARIRDRLWLLSNPVYLRAPA